MMVAVTPLSADALETEKCTARPNGSSGNDVMGGAETRITWEGQADADEQVKAISLTFPEGTTFSLDNARLTMLAGADHMDRVPIRADFSAEGQTVTATFANPADAGGYFRVEIYGVFFPASGGEEQITGSYVTADGQDGEISGIPAIPVTGVDVFERASQFLEQQEWVAAWNSVKFLQLFLNPVLIVTSIPMVFNGFLVAVATVAASFPFAILLGFLLSLMRMSKFALFRGIATTYVNIIRGTPLFLQIYIAFFGLPLAGIKVDPLLLGVIVLFMNSGAYLCEIFRAGIQSISKGQFEAARSLGMNGAQTMIFVIVPQTIRRVIPTMTSEFILLYKDTSMLAAVGTMEIVMRAKTIVASTGSITPYVVAALFYLVLTLPLAKIVGVLERKLAGNDSGSALPGKKRKRKKGAGNAGAAETRDPRMAQRGSEGERSPITPEQMSSL